MSIVTKGLGGTLLGKGIGNIWVVPWVFDREVVVVRIPDGVQLRLLGL